VSWAPGSGTKIGNGWAGFTHLTAGEHGHLFAVNPNGDMLLYKHAGGPQASWPIAGKVVGNGWNFKEILCGRNGQVYTIGHDGIMKLYKFDYHSHTWPTQGQQIGNGWNFKTCIPGGSKVYAFGHDGNLKWYKYNGSGSSWDNGTGNQIGNGWNFEKVFASLSNKKASTFSNYSQPSPVYVSPPKVPMSVPIVYNPPQVAYTAPYVRAEVFVSPQGMDNTLSEEMKKASAIFRQFDTNSNGVLDKVEFKKAMSTLGYKLRKGDTDKLFNVVDKDKNGVLSEREFCEYWVYSKQHGLGGRKKAGGSSSSSSSN